jgi:L-ribulose-5-phosphate 4-epimerase
MSFKELKKRVCEANQELPRRGLVVFTFGNVSGIDRGSDVFAIKPSGVSYKDLVPDMMVVLDLDCRVIEGALNPSSDTRTHAFLYRSFPNIGGICHTHSTFATAWAQAARSIPCLGTTHADHSPCDIPCTAALSDEQIRSDYEEETGRQIVKRFSDLSPEDVEMALVARHGPFTWGRTPEKAVYNSVVLEEMAKIALYTLIIAPECGPVSQALIDRHYFRKHGGDATYGQDEDRNKGGVR